mmetsp:Transcript_9904/g.13715  ORF Transcript_9904/g.13715 Transcript_9904/m.13715 type:complete len:442 (+) Transcript_9904:93-1418(+)
MEVIGAENDENGAPSESVSYKSLFTIALSTLILGLGVGAMLVWNQGGGTRDGYIPVNAQNNEVYSQQATQDRGIVTSEMGAFFHKVAETAPPEQKPARSEFGFRMMSFNIRRDFKSDGVNQWKRRIGLVREMLSKEAPDIIGMQELLPIQMIDMKTMLPEYGVVGVGRDDGKDELRTPTESEFVPVFYRKDKFRKLHSGDFWLSRTPDVPGTIYPGAGCTRVTSWALLQPLHDAHLGVDILAMSTHLDHVSEAARDQGAEVIRLNIRKILNEFGSKSRGTAVIIVGDFNAEPNEAALGTFLNDPTDDHNKVLSDSRLTALKASGHGREFGTFPNWNARSTGKIIDYVLYSPIPLKCRKRSPAAIAARESFMGEKSRFRRISRESRECAQYEMLRGSASSMIAAEYRVSIDDSARNRDTQLSDHRPVVVDFRIGSRPSAMKY